MKHYETELPIGYKETKVIDAKDKTTIIIMNIIVIVISILLICVGIILFNFLKEPIVKSIKETKNIRLYPLVFLLLVVVVILHELIHGLFYKIFTRQKLTFGITLSAAFCGVPKIYVYRKAMIFTAMAPCVILSIILAIPMFLSNSFIWFLGWLTIFSIHFSGCIGDIYSTILLVFKYKNENTLINDTGPKQTIYIKKD